MRWVLVSGEGHSDALVKRAPPIPQQALLRWGQLSRPLSNADLGVWTLRGVRPVTLLLSAHTQGSPQQGLQ